MFAAVRGKRGIMPGSPNPSATSTVTSGTTPKTRKIKTIAVIRRPHAPNENSGDGDTGNDPPALSKKTKLMVARQPRPSEGRLFEDDRPSLHTAGPDKEGNNGDSDIDRYRSTIATGAGKLRWLPDGHVVEKSILGTAAAFEEVRVRLLASFRMFTARSKFNVSNNYAPYDYHLHGCLSNRPCLLKDRTTFLPQLELLTNLATTQSRQFFHGFLHNGVRCLVEHEKIRESHAKVSLHASV